MIPSRADEESRRALGLAKQALATYRKFWPGDPSTWASEMYKLDLFGEDVYLEALLAALDELTPKRRCGPQPPNDISSRNPFPGLKMYAFCWSSDYFDRHMYLKFALTETDKQPQLVVFSLHQQR